MNEEFILALETLQKEKNINKMDLIESIEDSIKSAYKKTYGNPQNVDVRLNHNTGEIKVFTNWLVVDSIEHRDSEILITDAQKYNADIQLGEMCKIEVEPKDFGRIAAQKAKQQIFQKIKEAEKNIIYQDFLEKQEEIITGIVTRVDNNYISVDIGNGEAALIASEQIPNEIYYPNQRLKLFVYKVEKNNKGLQVNISRTHYGLVKRLFEDEVPEIVDGVVDIIDIAREAGSRTKISVKTNDQSIDPVGSCVGHKGVRVQNIINELNGEKIDVIKYSDNIQEYIANALSPAKVKEVLVKKSEKEVVVVVDDYQFSLAIGKEGQNVRLAAKLTGWKIDIKSASDFEKLCDENLDYRENFQNKTINQNHLLDALKIQLDESLNVEVQPDDDEDFETEVIDGDVLTS